MTKFTIPKISPFKIKTAKPFLSRKSTCMERKCQYKKGERMGKSLGNHVCISFDATIRNSFSLASVVSRDSTREVIEIWTERNLTTTPVIAEALAAKLAFKMAEHLNHPYISLVGDFQLIIFSIYKEERIWQIESISNDIVASLESQSRSGWKFHKIDRSQNWLAHSVAQWQLQTYCLVAFR